MDSDLLLQIAAGNGVAETAFFIKKEDHFLIRWFTPEIEMDLCGHATLVTAHILKTQYYPDQDGFQFQSPSDSIAVKVNKELYTMEFPSRMPITAPLPVIIEQSLNIQPLEVLKSRDYLLVYESEDQVRSIVMERTIVDQLNLDPCGICVTAMGKHCDFVSRFFTPQASIFEDPVTGSAHCSLIPYWAKRLGKNKMIAEQISKRSGTLQCENEVDKVCISGYAKTYLKGMIFIDDKLH